MAVEIKLFENPGFDDWRKKYWEQKEQSSSGDHVLKERDKEQEVKDFYDAQKQISKDVLPEQTQSGALVQLFDQQLHRVEDFASDLNPKEDFINHKKKENEMQPTPSQAFDLIYPMPFGNQKPQSPNQEPSDKLELNKKGTLLLDVKNNSAEWIGDHYLPKQTQDYKDDYTPPQSQLSSGSTEEKKCNKTETTFASTNVGELIELALKNKK